MSITLDKANKSDIPILVLEGSVTKIGKLHLFDGGIIYKGPEGSGLFKTDSPLTFSDIFIKLDIEPNSPFVIGFRTEEAVPKHRSNNREYRLKGIIDDTYCFKGDFVLKQFDKYTKGKEQRISINKLIGRIITLNTFSIIISFFPEVTDEDHIYVQGHY